MFERITGWLKDLWTSKQSKRAQATFITMMFVAASVKLGVSIEIAGTISALVISFVIGDSIRPVNPDKYRDLFSD